MVDKYEIAREVEIENFTNAMECLDYDPEDYTEQEISKMFDELEELLANDDMYSGIYNECIHQVLKKHQK